MWSPVSCFVLPQYQSGLRLLPPRQVEPAEICKMIGFQSNPRGQEEFFYFSSSQPGCASGENCGLTPWFLYFLIASFSFWAADLWALWKLSRAFVKSACNLSRWSFHCLRGKKKIFISSSSFTSSLWSSPSQAFWSSQDLHQTPPGVKSLLRRVAVQLLQLRAGVLGQLASIC